MENLIYSKKKSFHEQCYMKIPFLHKKKIQFTNFLLGNFVILKTVLKMTFYDQKKRFRGIHVL